MIIFSETKCRTLSNDAIQAQPHQATLAMWTIKSTTRVLQQKKNKMSLVHIQCHIGHIVPAARS
jgi:hypothetical protein